MERENQEYELSICFPIYNRLECFKYTFDKFIAQINQLDSAEKDLVEVVVSVNPSKDVLEETRNYLLEKQREFYFTININEDNVGISRNIDNAVHLSHGKMIWIIGDDDLILDGCVSRVVKILKKYPDVNWIYLASARLNGYPNDMSSLVMEVNNYQLEQGYYKNGKYTAAEVHKKIGGRMLFSTSNIFLKSMYLEINEASNDVGWQLGPTFASAAKGAVYLDNQVGILAGGCVSWKSIADHSLTIRYFQDMCSAIGHGYTRSEIKNLIGYHMWHEGLSIWFLIYKLFLKGSEHGRTAFKFFFNMLPIQTVLTLVLSPVLAFYLCLRHQRRKMRRKRSCVDYVASENPDEVLVARIRI